MDPLSITAATIGITTFALTSIKQLRNTIDDVAEVKEVIHDVSTSLTAILVPLDSLRELHGPDGNISDTVKADLDKAGVADAVNRCGVLCDDFAKRIAKWTKHSSGPKLSLRDRLSVGLWNKEKISTLRISVRSCQSTVQFAVQTTQLLIQIRSEQSLNADRQSTKQQLQVLETNIEAHLGSTQQLSGEISERRGRLEVQVAEAEDDAQENDGILAIREVEEQARILEEDLVSSGVMHTRIHAKLTNQTIGDVLLGEGSVATVGLPKSAVGKMNQRLGNVTTDKNCRTAVGVFPDDVRF